VQTFGCRLGQGETGNASKLNDALTNRGNHYPLSIPAGQLEITEPVVWPARTGYSLLGVGASKDLADNQYTDSGGIGGAVSRIVWHAGAHATSSDKMLDYKGLGGTIERIHFQGRPTPTGVDAFAESIGATITGATNANPIVITSAGHGLSTGNQVAIRECLGNTAANGTWTVTRLTADTFSLDGSTGNGTYTTSPHAGTWGEPKALVGIKVNTLTSGGSVLDSGKLALRDCSFFQLQTGILFGRDMANLGALTDDNGGADNNADESSLQNLHFYYPYDDNTAHEARTCMRFRTNQAVDFDMSGIRVKGNPSEIFYFERGGRLVCTHASLSGAQSAANPTTVLRVGKPTGTENFQVHCDIDGSTGIGTPGHPGDGIGGHFKLVQVDNFCAGQCYVEYSGTICPTNYDVPIVNIFGGTTLVLRGVRGLIPQSIQMYGQVGGGVAYIANVHLEGCALSNCLPSDLVTPSSSFPAGISHGPWRLTWSHCTQFKDNNYGIPISDGALDSTSRGETGPGTL
jgi:hypothetical protein